MIFTDYELGYLKTQSLGRLATVATDGAPHVRPLGFEVNDDGTIDIGGPGLSKSQKWRNIEAHPEVSFVIDDMTPDEPGAVRPGWGRGIEVRGVAELVTGHKPAYGGEWFSNETIRIHPKRILSWHLDPDQLQYNRDVA
ncbi:PPOX class F420-dependent oxidoreductase [Amycolatopsis sp.]|uniref:PPOX class F420-dependent oxidoreductase n=1 Tax=Amycolatopsis sp. TaxID=37632 RepID=UPI002C7C08C0|nr:PPOX class F420-dependent oxidoreductase [Amycolatopsis sp.]HVV09160.1 PPOX class F420-dependent oxidoreductase [Amycolatopsis sp.]